MELNSYEINVETLLILPLGKSKSKIFELDGDFIVNMSPLAIIRNSCLFFGCTYEGRRDASKEIIGIDMKVPIIIEDSRNIIFFPTSSCINKSSSWISYQNLLKYSKLSDSSSILYFKNGKSIQIDIKYNLIDNQVVRCIKLDTLLIKRRTFFQREKIFLEE